jgi:uncharacterized protein YneF (UPF0154 family)
MKIALVIILIALAAVIGFQVGYYAAPQQAPPVQLVTPPHWIPDKQPTVETI